MGLLFIVLGIIMIVINQLQTRSEEKQLESYVKARLGKSTSGAPLVRTPVLQVLFSKQHSFIMDVHFYKVIIHFFHFPGLISKI